MGKFDSLDIDRLSKIEKNGKQFLRNGNSSEGKMAESIIKTPFSSASSYDPEIAERSVNPALLLLDKRFWRIAHTLWVVTMSSWADDPDATQTIEQLSQIRRD